MSAGGVVYRRHDAAVDVALIRVGAGSRWQLPKGLVDDGEAPAATAVREVREEVGVDARVIAPLDDVEYWYVGSEGGERVRYHKRVHFFLLEYQRGDPADHDHEVEEARWVPLADAETMLAFANEQRVLHRAKALLEA